MKFYQASLDTRNFSFEAYGRTYEQARNALIEAFRKHGIQSRMTPDWWEALADGIVYRELDLGKAYRDREPL